MKNNFHLDIPIRYKISADTLDSHETLTLSQLLPANIFVLRVSGEDMNGDNIHDGDYVLCRQAVKAEPGDIAIILIDGEGTTLRRIEYGKDDTVLLISSDSDNKPMVYQKSQIKIQGVYIGFIRLMSEQNILPSHTMPDLLC